MRRVLGPALLAVALLAVAAPAVARTVVLFDEGHGQQFLSGKAGDLDLSGLATLLREAGCEVRTNRGRLDGDALKGVSALIVSGAFASLDQSEAEAVLRFVAAGGRLAVMLHIGPPVQVLLEKIGVQYSRGPIHDSESAITGRSGDFAVTRFESHPLTDGLARLSVFGCFALKPIGDSAARVIAGTGPHAWLDTDRNGVRSSPDLVGAQGLVVAGEPGIGAYVVFGDDAIFQNRFLTAYNSDIGRRLALWLAAARAPGAPSRQPKSGGTTDL